MMWHCNMLAAMFATAVAQTGVLLPLYVYPSADYNDGAANWRPALDAIASNSNLQWLVVINPFNGPGLTLKPGNDDINYISGVSQMNANSNIRTVGYVRTNYSRALMDELKQNITAYRDWATYQDQDISLKGIFFDETADNFPYMSEAISFARQAFGSPITIICNFGVKARVDYYSLCDVVIPFESCLNCPDLPQYKGKETLDANIPSGEQGKAAIIVNKFTGTAYDGKTADVNLLYDYLKTIRSAGVGWAYFCSADYNEITVAPATVGQNALGLTEKRRPL